MNDVDDLSSGGQRPLQLPALVSCCFVIILYTLPWHGVLTCVTVGVGGQSTNALTQVMLNNLDEVSMFCEFHKY